MMRIRFKNIFSCLSLCTSQNYSSAYLSNWIHYFPAIGSYFIRNLFGRIKCTVRFSKSNFPKYNLFQNEFLFNINDMILALRHFWVKLIFLFSTRVHAQYIIHRYNCFFFFFIIYYVQESETSRDFAHSIKYVARVYV